MDYDSARFLASEIGEQIAMNKPEQPTLLDQMAMAVLPALIKLHEDWAMPMIIVEAYDYAEALMAEKAKREGK